MIGSRDLALIIVFAVLNLIFMFLIGEVPELITGIPGISYAFSIVYSIILTVSWLMYEGRRWRIVAQSLLFSLLALLFIPIWTRPAVMATTINGFIVDVVFNNFYGFFKQKNKHLWWAILSQVYYWSTHSMWFVFFASLFFYPFELIMEQWFLPIMPMMLPIMIVEGIAGGYIGYKIYRRVEKLAA